MKTRAVTGFFFVIIMLASMLNGAYLFSFFFMLLSMLCLNEFYSLVKSAGIQPNKLLGLCSGLVIFGSIASRHLFNLDVRLVLLIIPLLCAVFAMELYKKTNAPFTNIAYTLLGLFFTIVPFGFFHEIGFMQGSFNFHFPLAFLLLLWANDTGAYLTGMKFGKTKLFERHSPKKTWEGFLGGMFIAVIISLIIAQYFTEISWKNWISIALLISGFGTMGDLIESMLKRSMNVKDSGTILPGHGGLLDRFDGLLLSAPLVFTYLYFISNS
ncbi:MAG: phosphatidate cytidylyltransferase [Sphingobacteriaceae bacterium]